MKKGRQFFINKNIKAYIKSNKLKQKIKLNINVISLKYSPLVILTN